MQAPTIPEYDLYLFGEGKCLRLFDHFGAHPAAQGGRKGVRFAVWAPNARSVSVVGDFNNWNPSKNAMNFRRESGVWELFIENVAPGALYKYEIIRSDGHGIAHCDPLGFRMETPPESASIVYDLAGYEWKDHDWLSARARPAAGADSSIGKPFSIYELHLGSWRRRPDGTFLNYRELASVLPDYVADMGFTHVEFMPVAEHPYYGSWGYQQTGMYAPTSRFGTPHELMALIDAFHRKGIGVLLDWVPAHFPTDAYGLARFDGTGLYEHIDPRKGFHQDWKTYIFNYGRNEVANFLLANALFWIEKYHIDGLRVDAVSSMLYLDYSRKEGEWVPNKYGGRENLEAIEFLRSVNTTINEQHPGVMMIAEESTTFAGITRSVHVGGLGYNYKWNLGWMHDWLDFFSKDPIARKYHSGLITFSMWYAYSEKFILNLGHDEVVHMKGSLLNKMPGEAAQKAANLRALVALMYAHPGGKLLFMGSELAPWTEWNHERGLEWNLLDYPMHAGMTRLVRELNHLYKNRPELHALDEHPDGFEWVDFRDVDQSTYSWLRHGPRRETAVLIVANLTPVERGHYRIGVPRPGFYKEILNTDGIEYSGSGIGNLGGVVAEAVPKHQREYSVELTLPPLGVLYFEVPPASQAAPAVAPAKLDVHAEKSISEETPAPPRKRSSAPRASKIRRKPR
ncbi:MAG: 1,4-alpha-glucan branching protein GlgB [Planctomycetes bacterium]|nr:1,4-alpha-glucan branching protein GlgB [Planctomycetota bacterium]